MMRWNITALLFYLLCYSPLYSQEENEIKPSISRSSFYIELAGNALIYSVNYDLILLDKGKFSASGRVGFSLWTVDWPNNLYTFPAEINGMIGSDPHHVELGVGHITWLRSFDNGGEHITDLYSGISGRIGYRYQKSTGGLIFRAGIVPIYIIVRRQFFPWLGLGVGYNLKSKK